MAARLVLEVDGATHWTPAELDRDDRRSRYLEQCGWHVLRVSNADVYENLDGVWRTIAHHLPPPRVRCADGGPPPQAGEE